MLGTEASILTQNVVWEKLDDLLGNTQFLKADFTPYGSNSLADQVSDAADLVQAAFAGIAPTKGHASTGTCLPSLLTPPGIAGTLAIMQRK